jgi:molecular chaperone GrpE
VSTPESTETQEAAANTSADSEASGTANSDENASGGQPANAAEANAAEANAGAESSDDASGSRDSAEQGAGAARIEELEEELASVRSELDEANEKYLRKAAELENFRRRMERETARRYTAGQVDVVKAMLGVLDDMGRSIEAAEELKEKQDAETAYDSLRGGVEMVYRKFSDELQNLGVERIDAEGEPFDESLHEAMMQQPAPEGVEPGTVINEVQAGYKMGDRVIRHSRVIVAS